MPIRRNQRSPFEAAMTPAFAAELARCTGPAADRWLAKERAALARWTDADGYLADAEDALEPGKADHGRSGGARASAPRCARARRVP